MQTSYIYSVSRVNTLREFLLTKADIERLLVATPGDDLHSALKETYLAPYITRVPDEDMSAAIEVTLVDAKRMIHRIAPAGDMFRVLWVHYDIHNLRVFAKAKATGASFVELAQYVSQRGIYEPITLHENAENGTLDSMQVGWNAQSVYNQATALVAEGKLEAVDALFDALYFETSQTIAKKSGDAFISKYLTATIDIYNLKSRLRALTHESVNENAITFITGGSFHKESIITKEDVLASFSRLGGTVYWQDAVDTYNKTANTTTLDVRADEYLVELAKTESHDMFSSASLVLYYLLCRQAAANVRTIVVGKNSGMSEEAIRANLRMSHVND